MSQTTNAPLTFPSSVADAADSPVADVLTDVLRRGARAMLVQAVEAEAQQWIDDHAHLVDERGHRQVVRNGHANERSIVTGIGPMSITMPRVHDRRPVEQRERFTSRILPPYLRKSRSVEELIPWLYLKGISTGDYSEALQALLGLDCPGLPKIELKCGMADVELLAKEGFDLALDLLELRSCVRRNHDVRLESAMLLIELPGVQMMTSTLVFDLLCIHPFRDGNGRISRLLTTLLLTQQGFIVGRYVSLERLIEESKEDYYHVLGECSQGWHEGRNPVLPWWNYFLGIVRRGYVEFSRRVEGYAGQPAKTELARRSILVQVGDFTLADIQSELPGISSQLLKKVLADMKAAGQVSLVGRGRGAKWRVL